MSVTVSIDLPDDLATAARVAAGGRPLEDAVLDWIGRAVADPPVETLSDADVLALSHSVMPADQHVALSDLLAGQREGTLTADERGELDRLMTVYRRGLLRKAEALKVAVDRGLRPRLDRAAP